MKAIKDTGNSLVAAMDPHDSVGILDSYFPATAFFTEFERFDRHIDKLRRAGAGNQAEFVSICSPNYLHDSHVRFALRSGTDAICEKPVVLNPWNIDALQEFEHDTGNKVNTILQLRLHNDIRSLRDTVIAENRTTKHEVDLTYITSRGQWYVHSWKGDIKRSGGIATNIGVHFFDMLYYIFGPLQDNFVHYSSDTKAGGYLEYQNARVRWFLSVDAADLPQDAVNSGRRTHRSIVVDGTELEFSDGFGDLHNRSYEKILAGQGFGLEDNRVATQAVAHIRTGKLEQDKGDHHSMVKSLISGR